MSFKSPYEQIEECANVLKLDFNATDMSMLADQRNYSDEGMKAILDIFLCLKERKEEAVVNMLLKTSRLPLTAPKTFENYDFSRIKGKDIDSLRALKILTEVHNGKNIAFIGPPGVGKTHLAEAYGYECCMSSLKTYMLKASELRDKFITARKYGREASTLNYLIKPSCLIIDEVGRCKFDRECTAMFFDMVDRRYQKEPPKCMIFTSNKQPSEWLEFFSSDDDLRAALDRIFDDAKVFTIKGESYRGRKLEVVSLEAGTRPVSE